MRSIRLKWCVTASNDADYARHNPCCWFDLIARIKSKNAAIARGARRSLLFLEALLSARETLLYLAISALSQKDILHLSHSILVMWTAWILWAAFPLWRIDAAPDINL